MTAEHGQFMVLMTKDTNLPSFNPSRQNIVVVNNHNELLMCIATTRFDLILLDLTANCSVASTPDPLRLARHPRQSELIARIKDPLGLNNNTPVVAIIDPADEQRCPMEFDDRLIKPITEERLNKLMDFWQVKTSVLAYSQTILSKTKNNRRLALTIFEKLFEELPLQLIDIEYQIENKHYDLAQGITHKLHGSASFCGLTDIQQSAKALENALLNHKVSAINQDFLILQQQVLNFTRHQVSILVNLGKSG